MTMQRMPIPNSCDPCGILAARDDAFTRCQHQVANGGEAGIPAITTSSVSQLCALPIRCAETFFLCRDPLEWQPADSFEIFVSSFHELQPTITSTHLRTRK